METVTLQSEVSSNMESRQTEASKMETEMPEEVYKTDLTRLHDLAILHNLHMQFKELKHIGTPQERIFKMELRVGEFVGLGSGSTKKKAKLQAASEVVTHLAKLPVPETVTPYWSRPRNELVNIEDRQYFFFDKNPVCALVEVLTVRREKAPEFRDVKTTYKGHVPWYTVEVRVGEMTMQAEAPHKKKVAKEMAADRMLEMMGFENQMRRDKVQAQGLQRAFIPPSRPAQAPRPGKQPPTTAKCTNPLEVPQITVDKVSEVSQASCSAEPSPAESVPPEPQVSTAEQLTTPQDVTSTNLVTPTEAAIDPEVSTSEHEFFSTPQIIPEPTEPFVLPEDCIPPEDITEPETHSSQKPSPEDFCPVPQQFLTPLDVISSAEPNPSDDCPYELKDVTVPEDSSSALKDINEPETHSSQKPSPEDFFSVPQQFLTPLDVISSAEPNPSEDSPYEQEDVTVPEDSSSALEDLPDPAVSSAPQPTQLPSDLYQTDLPASAGSLTEASAHSSSSTYPQESGAPQSSSTTHTMVKAMAKKLLQKSPVSLDTQQQVDLVHRLEEVESRVLVPEDLELGPEMMKLIGKAATKGLLLEFGSSSALLSQSEEDFIKATVKHLQIQIRSSQNHPLTAKPWLKQVLSKVFKRNRIPPGAFSDYLSSEPEDQTTARIYFTEDLPFF